MKIAVGNSRMDKKWKNKDISWEKFKTAVRVTKRTTETVSEYRKLGDLHRKTQPIIMRVFHPDALWQIRSASCSAGCYVA